MRPSALTQAARSVLGRREAAPPPREARPARAARPPRHEPRPARAQRSPRHEPRPARPGRPARPPRRVSGPVRGKGSTGSAPRVAAAARSATIAVPLHTPFRPKGNRKPPSREHRSPDRATARERPAPRPLGLARRIGSFAAAVPDHSWLDRVVRGRAWIPLLGILLAGIVAAQVEILKLGASMGRALEQTTTLTAQNEQLRGSVAQLADDQRIERLAGAMGLVLPPPGAVGYLAARPGADVSGALGNIHIPNPAAFVAMTPRNGALVTGPGASTLPPTAGAPAPPAPATTTSAAPPASGMSSASATTTTPTTSITTTGAAAIQPSGTTQPSAGG